MRRNDTRPYFQVTLMVDGEAVDLTGATVMFHANDSSGLSRINAAATIIQSSPTVDKGVVEYRFVPANTAVSGTYDVEWEVTFSDGTVQTFPTNGLDRLLIRDDQS